MAKREAILSVNLDKTYTVDIVILEPDGTVKTVLGTKGCFLTERKAEKVKNEWNKYNS